jgi:hypothetical protein
MSTILSDHSKKRGKERLGLKPKSLQKVSDEAYTNGHTIASFSGSFRRYLDKLAITGKGIIRVHNKSVFIFKANVLITVYQVPSQYRDCKGD